MIDIIIPTNKPSHKLKAIMNKAFECAGSNFRIMATCFNASAATNRNYGLNQATSEIVIMIDDDIRGFFPGWAEKLMQPLLENRDVVMVSARLMKSKCVLGVMMNIKPDLSKEVVEVPDRMLPSACIAFRNDGTRFDEGYIGASFEDTDHCMQLNQKYPNAKYLIHNGVKLIHLNRMTNQLQGQLMRNQIYFNNKWGIR